MEYKFEKIQKNDEDFASGRVLYNAHGTTSFPVRLASEIIQRCFQILENKGNKGPYSLYDPCCGGAYLLTVIGLIHGHRIKSILASDINSEVLGIAENNLSLLSESGLSKRKEQHRYTIPFKQKRQPFGCLFVRLSLPKIQILICFLITLEQFHHLCVLFAR